MSFLSNLFYFVIVIGVLILIHELGHFLAARLTKTRADIFSIGMGARLFGYNRINGFTFGKLSEDIELNGHTDYRICMLPIGGYVKIVGMVDESFDTDFAGKPAEPWEFRSKNVFQKSFILAAGVIMNLLLAIGIFSGIAYFSGTESYETTTVGYVQKDSPAKIMGLVPGDKILSINSHVPTNWSDVEKYLVAKDFGANKEIMVARNGKDTLLKSSGSAAIQALSSKKDIGLEPSNSRCTFGSVVANAPADKAGFKNGDTVVKVNGEIVVGNNGFVEILKANKGKTLPLTVKRGADTITKTITTSDKGTIGVQLLQIHLGKIIEIKYGFGESVVFGYNQTVMSMELLVKMVSQIFKGNLAFKESIGGPIMIAQQASQQAERGVASFLNFMAMLSVSLAFLNILPFPALDGGHLVFTIIESIIRREIPIKAKMFIQQAGFIILLVFMAVVLYNDIMR